jgi:hypothetical protein
MALKDWFSGKKSDPLPASHTSQADASSNGDRVEAYANAITQRLKSEPLDGKDIAYDVMLNEVRGIMRRARKWDSSIPEVKEEDIIQTSIRAAAKDMLEHNRSIERQKFIKIAHGVRLHIEQELQRLSAEGKRSYKKTNPRFALVLATLQAADSESRFSDIDFFEKAKSDIIKKVGEASQHEIRIFGDTADSMLKKSVDKFVQAVSDPAQVKDPALKPQKSWDEAGYDSKMPQPHELYAMLMPFIDRQAADYVKVRALRDAGKDKSGR